MESEALKPRGRSLIPRRREDRIAAGLLLILGIAIFFVVLTQNPVGIDWRFTYRPAALSVAQGQSPYGEESIYFAAPWALIPLIPFAILPEAVGRSLFFVVSLAIFAYLAYRMKAAPAGVLFFLLSPPVANCIQTGNIEWLALLGVVLPPQIGLVLLAIKPQTTAGIGLFILVEAWQRGGFKEVLRIVWPVVIITLLSFAIFGLWPLRWGGALDVAAEFNISLWPQGIPMGAVLLALALRNRDQHPALVSGPFFAPHAVLSSWSGAMLGLAPSTLLMAVASVTGWVYWLLYLSMIR